MAEDINPAVIKYTQETLGKYVKKPSLTEKLLKKPPFRFLHDVFSVVIRDTGCFEGLYTADELNSEHIKDRDDKMRFLQKMIDVVRICTNVPMTVKTSKIVAGHEPEKTNELLQLMAKIIENKLNWQPAVEQVLKGKEAKTNEKPKEKDKPKDKKEVVKPKESSKPPKATSKLSKQSSVSKEDKTKRPKEKEKTAAASKDKTTSKTNKAAEEKTRRPKDSTKPKLAKADSQASNKSISPANKEIKSTKLFETASPVVPCEHGEEEPKQVDTKRRSSVIKDRSLDNLDSMNKELFKQADDFMDLPPNKKEERKQTPPGDVRASAKIKKPKENTEMAEMSPQRQDNRKLSGKSRKTPTKESPEMSSPARQDSNSRKSSGKSRKEQTKEHPEMSPQRQDNNSRKSSAKSRKSIDLSHHEAGFPLDLPEKENLQQMQATLRNKHEQTGEKKSEKITSPEIALRSEKKSKNPLQSPSPPPPPIPVNSEVKRESTFTRENSKDIPNTSSNRPRTSLRPPSARPPSARPGAPRRRDRNIEIILQPNDQIKMSGIQVKLETFGDLDDDGENLVIIENPNTVNGELPQDDEVGMGVAKSETGLGNETMEQQGHLVQQILETQKELTQQKDFNQQIKNEKDSVNGMVLKQTSMNNLRDVIQGLTKSVNPLGKLMDFIPEDIDAMQLEFTMWRDAYTQAANQLKREKSLTESATEPMKNQLIQIESNIQEYMEMIDASRVKIIQSNDKILKMLTTS